MGPILQREPGGGGLVPAGPRHGRPQPRRQVRGRGERGAAGAGHRECRQVGWSVKVSTIFRGHFYNNQKWLRLLPVSISEGLGVEECISGIAMWIHGDYVFKRPFIIVDSGVFIIRFLKVNIVKMTTKCH